MKRRTVLSALEASVIPLTGCIGQNGSEGDPTGTASPSTDTPKQVDNRTTTETPPVKTVESGLPRTVTLEGHSNSELRENFDIAADVTVLESGVTTAHTAKIWVTLENTAAKTRTITYTRDTCGLNLIPGRYQRDKDIQLLLISTEQKWKRTEEDCWKPDGRNLNCGIPAMDHEVTIAPDESVRWTFRLWTDPENHQNGVCMPLGVYQFSRAFKREEKEASLIFRLSVDSE